MGITNRYLTGFLVFVLTIISDSAQGNVRRIQLFSLTSEGYEELEKKQMSWDIGVQETANNQGAIECSLLRPREGTQAAKWEWAPLDIYYNAVDDAERTRLRAQWGERDIYFEGDDLNRNGKGEDHTWTLKVPKDFRESLDFFSRKMNDSQTRLELDIGVTRGSLVMRRLFRVDAVLENGRCVAHAFLCTKPDDKGICDENNWLHQIREIVAHIDVAGGLLDRARAVRSGKLKNDIESLVGLVIDLSEESRQELEIQLAEKK